MPLIKGKSEKSFVKNLKTEMEHGKPQKQSLAIAYAMKRKAQKKKMADGGEIPTLDPDKLASTQDSMRKAFGYADGGKVDSPNWNAKGWQHEKDNNEGVHREVTGGGQSYVGTLVRKGQTDRAIDRQKSQMSHNAASPSPKLKGLAEGGQVCEHCGGGMMAEGGQITDNYQSSGKVDTDPDMGFHEFDKGYVEHEGDVKRPNMMAHSEDDKGLNQHPVDMHAETSMAEEDLVDRIMMNRKQNNAGEAKFSEGGKVANQDEIEAGFDPNEFDDLHLRDDLSSSYGEDDNAGDDLGNKQEDEDRADLVDRIMLRNFKQKIPRGYPGR